MRAPAVSDRGRGGVAGGLAELGWRGGMGRQVGHYASWVAAREEAGWRPGSDSLLGCGYCYCCAGCWARKGRRAELEGRSGRVGVKGLRV
jgi:hypothetical protein